MDAFADAMPLEAWAEVIAKAADSLTAAPGREAWQARSRAGWAPQRICSARHSFPHPAKGLRPGSMQEQGGLRNTGHEEEGRKVREDPVEVRPGSRGIGVVGVGGLGSAVCPLLLSLGVRDITLIDDDVLDRSNRNRWLLHTRGAEGTAKVDAAGRRLRVPAPLDGE